MKGDSDTLRYVNDHFAHQLMKGLKDIYEEDLTGLDDSGKTSDDDINLKPFGSSDINLFFVTKLNSTADQVAGFLIRLGVVKEASKQVLLDKIVKTLHRQSPSEEKSQPELNCWKRALLQMGFPLDVVDSIMNGRKSVIRRFAHELLETYRHDLFYFSQNKVNSEKAEIYLMKSLQELEVNHKELEKYIFDLGLDWQQSSALVTSLGLNRLKAEVCLEDFDMSLEKAKSILDLLGYSVFQIDDLLIFRKFLDSQRKMLA